MSASKSDTTPPIGYRLKLLGIGGLIGLLLGSGLAVKVWLDGRDALDAQRAEADRSLAELGASRDALEGERDACQDRIEDINQDLALLVARVEVARAVADLDERNLGLANKHLSEAGEVLARADPAQAGAARERVDATRLVVGGDFERQRSELIRLGASLDALLGE